jgi:uncharacterized membrane protein YfcA
MAEIIGTIGGFGSSLFFVPIASYFLDFQSVLGITAVFHVSSNISKITMFRKGFDKQLIIFLGLPAVIFVIIGAILSKHIQLKFLEIGLAIFLISISLLLLFYKKFVLTPNKFNSVSGGILSGLIAGLIGTGGAIRGLVLAAYGLSTEAFIATSALIDLGIDASRSVVYFLNGYVHQNDLYLIPILFVISFIGTFIGKQILKKFNQQQFKTFVLILILVTGLVTLFKYIN